jgi:hypothetical protein
VWNTTVFRNSQEFKNPLRSMCPDTGTDVDPLAVIRALACAVHSLPFQ